MRTVMAALLVSVAAHAGAEVKNTNGTGFEIENKRVVAASPTEAWAMLGRIGEWWNPAHSYSGDAANLRIALKAGGCFCEALPASGGSVEHMRVVHARPGELLRLQGGLGPLQGEAVAGTLDWRMKPVEGGTEITQTYIVSGSIRAGAAIMAAPVGAVLDEQLSRLAAKLENRE